jgi:uncharacterized membrane protein
MNNASARKSSAPGDTPVGVWPTFKRIAHHLWLGTRDSLRAIGPQGLAQIEQAVGASERHHSGEIRVCIEAGLPMSYLWRGASARERAITLFGKLKVWDTEHNNGVLIYVLLADRRIEIVADRGLNACVRSEQWQGISSTLTTDISKGQLTPGMIKATAAVGQLLTEHFAVVLSRPDLNELPDSVALR